MDPNPRDILAVCMRFSHILAMTFLLGGVIYAKLAVYPSLAALPAAERQPAGDRIAALLRPWLTLAIMLLFVSGIYNLVNKGTVPRGYHMWFGIKILFALHVAAVSFLLGRPGVPNEKRARWVSGVFFSGLAVLLLSAILRSWKG